MSWGDLLAGFAVLSLVLGGAALATVRIMRARLAHLEGAVRATAAGVLFPGLVALAHVVPLAFGILSRGTVLAAMALIVAAAWRVRRAPERPRDEPRGRPASRAAWAVAGVTVGLALLYVAAFVRRNHALAADDLDSTVFILPTVADWVQRGTLWHVVNLAERWPFGEYPHTGNLLELAVVLPFRSDFLVRAVGPMGLLLAAIAGYALACELRAPRAAAATFAVLAVMMSGTAVSALDSAHTDVWAGAWLTGGALFLARHARTSDRTDLVLAGLAFGLAFGTKWYGPPFAAAFGTVWLAARLLRRVPWRRALGEAAGLGALVLAVGGIWLLRNLVESADPLFPARVAPFGIELFAGAQNGYLDEIGFSIAHYLPDWSVLRGAVLPQLWDSFNWPAAFIGSAMTAAGALAVLRRPRDWEVGGVVAAALLVLAAYVALPGTALGFEGEPTNVGAGARYTTSAFLAGGAAVAWLAGRIRGAGVALQALAIPAMVAAAASYDDWSLDTRYDVLSAGDLAKGALLLAAAALVAGLAAAAARRLRPVALAAAGAVALAAGAVVAHREADAFHSARYRGIDPTLDYIIDRAPEGHRIGLAGEPTRPRNSAQLPAHGPRLGNEVGFVGRHLDHLLHRHVEPSAFLRDLRTGGYDLLLVGEPGGPERETAWARSAGWRPIVRGNGYVLLDRPD